MKELTVNSINPDLSHENQDSDYDGAWKEALRFHLRDFIERCFAELAVLINWDQEPQWLDKEMSQIIGQSRHRNREVDLLFKVELKDGREQWILCHLEIQTNRETGFEFRIGLYNAGLKWLFRQNVLTLVILADLDRDWRPMEDRFELGGFGTHTWFPICKVLDRIEGDWIDDTSLVSQVARAQIAALRTSSDPEARFNAKTQLVRNLYDLGYNASDVREIFRLIDWMMHLRPDLSRRFKNELNDFEKERNMPYVTSIERIAKEEGIEEGIEQGIEQGIVLTVLKLLKRPCGPIPDDVQQSIRDLSSEQVQMLAEAIFDIHSLEDLKTWLRSSNH